MKIVTDINKAFLLREDRTCITLGKFDGVHLGHQRLFQIMKEDFSDQIPVAFTFDFSIRSVLSGKSVQNLFDADEKRALLENQGVEILVECPFDQVRTMPAKQFVKDILVDFLHVKTIVIGDDFHFGYNREGDAKLLETLAPVYSYRFVKIEKVRDEEGAEIGSTRIRNELISGNMEKVNSLLGFPYFIKGKVVHGKHLGERIGSPTINQSISDEKLLPPYGVYFSKVKIGDKEYPAVTNIGCKPTVSDEKKPGAETYIFDFDGDIYEQEVTTLLFYYERPEKTFPDIETLKKRISLDMSNAKEYWKIK